MTREHYDALLKKLDQEILRLGEDVARTIERSVDVLERRDAAGAQQLIRDDNEIDRQRYAIERDALLLIATQQPLAGDLRTVAAILTIATELERMGDYCEGIAELTLRLAAEDVDLPLGDIRLMAGLTRRLLHQVLEAYSGRDLAAAGDVWRADNEVDDLYERIYHDLLREMVRKPAVVRRDTYLMWIAHNLERIADRVTNIAERIAFVVNGDVETFRKEALAQTPPD